MQALTPLQLWSPIVSVVFALHAASASPGFGTHESKDGWLLRLGWSEIEGVDEGAVDADGKLDGDADVEGEFDGKLVGDADVEGESDGKFDGAIDIEGESDGKLVGVPVGADVCLPFQLPFHPSPVHALWLASSFHPQPFHTQFVGPLLLHVLLDGRL